MATYPLVEQVDRDLPALVGLSLEKNGIPVSVRFWIYSAATGQRLVAVVTPAVDELGTRDAYQRAFDALDKESFSTRQFLNSHLLLLGKNQNRETLDLIQEGVSRLPSLGPYEDVDIYLVPEADQIIRQGFLHFVPSGKNQFLVGFAGLDRDGGAMKTRPISVDSLDAFLKAFSVYEGDRQKILDSLKQNHTESILAQASLRKLYEAGLI